MTENDIMAELSYAYLHAVAARAGFGCKVGNRIDDNAGVDCLVRVNERMAPDSALWNFDFEIQLKATKQPARAILGRYSYFFQGIKRYNTLREPGSPLPKLLAVLFLPTNPEQWLKLDEKCLIARRCAYWVSLKGAPPSGNDTGQTVYLPKSQMLSVEGLRRVVTRLSREEELTYES
jgi:hypothetical protein